MLPDQDVEHDAVDLVVHAVIGDHPDHLARLSVAVDAPFALLVTGRVPGEVVMEDGVEVFLEVDPFAQAVGADQYALRRPRPVAARAPRVRPAGGCRSPPRPRLLSAAASRSSVGDVLGGRDEAAEDDWPIAVLEELADQLGGLLEFLVLVAAEGFGVAGHVQKTAVGAWSRRRASLGGSAPGVTSSRSAPSSSSRSSTARRPISSASSGVSCSAAAARLRSVAAAAAGLEAIARSSARADHQRTRCRCRVARSVLHRLAGIVEHAVE